MTNEKLQWLPHLTGMIPRGAEGNNLSMYAIGLEGWRRGMELTFYLGWHLDKYEVQYSLSYREKTHRFAISQGDLVSDLAQEICRDKNATKSYLKKAGVPTPHGQSFSASASDQEIVNFAAELGFPVVLKPLNGKLGRGVISNIAGKNQLEEALYHVRQKLNYQDVIVEQFITGDDYRIYVVAGKVAGAVKRVPAHITGDGHRTVKQLIEAKNKARKKNPNLSTRPVKMDQEITKAIEAAGLTSDSVLEKGSILWLRDKANISSGGDPIDITDQLPENLKEIAVNAVEAIPDLVHGGIDMIIDASLQTGVVLEANTRAGIGSHLFPVEGKGRDIPKAILDYYFPESPPRQSHMESYFDLREVTALLKSGTVRQLTLPPAHRKVQVRKSYRISGLDHPRYFAQFIQKKARDLNLDGFVQPVKKGNSLLVIAGEADRVNAFQLPSFREGRVEFTEEVWEKPVPKGFIIKEAGKKGQFKQMKAEIAAERKKAVQEKKRCLDNLNAALAERKTAEKRFQRLKESRTWRYSQNIRKFIRISKKN